MGSALVGVFGSFDLPCKHERTETRCLPSPNVLVVFMLGCKFLRWFVMLLKESTLSLCWYRVSAVTSEQRTTPSIKGAYDRSLLRRSIVHIGVGGFHRAHLATYVDELCRAGNTEWAIVGAGVMTADSRIADALGAQDHLYTLVSRGAEQTVSLTITEGLPDRRRLGNVLRPISARRARCSRYSPWSMSADEDRGVRSRF